MNRLSRNLVRTSLLIALHALPALALAQTGKIMGVVTDAETGESIPGASVLLEGTSQGAASDDEGRYVIIGIEPGVYDVRVSYVGYTPTLVEGVRVTSERTATLNLELSTEVVEGDEVVVVGERPVVDANQTTSRSLVTGEEMAQLPVASLQDVVARTANAYEGFVRGSRRFETKTIVEGIDVSDAYYALAQGRNYAGSTYSNTNRADETNASLFTLNPEGVEEVTVNTGATPARYSAASGGVVAITLEQERGPITGSFSARVAPQVGRPGPDSLAFYRDLDAYFAERDQLLAADDERAALYTFAEGKYDVGEDPEVDVRASLGGSITDRWHFSATGQWFETGGYLPNYYRQRLSGQLKTTYEMGERTRVTAVALVEDRGLWGGWNNRDYNERFRFYLEGVAQNDGGSYLGSLKLTQVLTNRSYVDVQAYRTFSRTRYGYVDDDGDGLTEPGEDGAFLDFNDPDVVERYIGTGDERSLMFYSSIADPYSSAGITLPGGSPYKLANPVPYSEDVRVATNGLKVKVDYSNQVTLNHLLQGGAELKLRRLSYDEVYGIDGLGFTLNAEAEPFVPSAYDRRPWELSLYAADRMEYGGLIVNLGLRVDVVDRDTEQITDYFYPFRRDTVEADGRRLARNVFERGEAVPLDLFVNPSIGVSHPIGSSAAMYFSYARSQQLVPYSTLYSNYGGNNSANRFFVYQDPAQDPITSNNYELGLQWEFAPGWGADVNAYMRSVDNYGQAQLIARNRTPEGAPSLTGLVEHRYATSFGYADVRGIELVLRRRPLQLREDLALGLTASYTFSAVERAYLTGDNALNFQSDPETGEVAVTIPFENAEDFRNFAQNVRGGSSIIDAGYDRAHRVILRGVASLPYDVSVGVNSAFESGFLYPRAIGGDPRDRQLLTAPANYQVDLRLEKTVRLYRAVRARPLRRRRQPHRPRQRRRLRHRRLQRAGPLPGDGRAGQPPHPQRRQPALRPRPHGVLRLAHPLLSARSERLLGQRGAADPAPPTQLRLMNSGPSVLPRLAARLPLGLLIAGLMVLAAHPASAQRPSRPSPLLQYNSPSRDFNDGDGYMVGGEIWETVKPMNTATPNGVEDPLAAQGYLQWITIGPDGGNWAEPVGMWPGGHQVTNSWRDGRRIVFPVFEADGWPDYDADNPIRAGGGDETLDERFHFAYYSPNLQGAGDPGRDYKRGARFTDASRTHLVAEAGWPTTAGIDFTIRAHQYTVNEQNLNDFVALEITLTNTGVVDTDGDGTPELTDHEIDAAGAVMWGLPTIAVLVGNTGVRRANVFGAGRTFGYAATPDATGAPYNLTTWYANVPPDRSVNRTVPPPGQRLFGVNNVRFLEGYTDVWNAWSWLGVKQGAIGEGIDGNAPDKPTLFGTHSVGEGDRRGWYTSMHWQPGLFGLSRSDLAFRTATATWYEDYGKTSSGDNPPDLAPNARFFSGGTADDVATFVVRDAGARPNGDFKYASEDLGEAVGIEQPIWEEAWNPSAGGNDFYGGTGFNKEYTFGEELISGIGPYRLAVGESITMLVVVTAGFRFEGVWEATQAARWAWERGWDISDALPVPPAPDVAVESTPEATALVRWTDVSAVDPDVDGYKVWRAAQFRRTPWLERGFRLVDRYHHQHEVDADVEPFLDPVNPFFDAEAEFTGETQGVYQPEGWGTYDLVVKVPADQLGPYQASQGDYDFVWEDENAITGFTYWYYVSAYKEGPFEGPQGAVPVGHIESANFNRNGRNGRGAAPGEIGLDAPWQGTYPYATASPEFPAPDAQAYTNLGAAFTVTPPVAPVDRVAELITVTPNPYKVTNLNDVRSDPSSHAVDFLNLPADYTLTILDVSGQVVYQTTAEGAVDGKFTWDLFSKDGVEVASGLYIYHVTYEGGEVVGHLAILR